MYYYIFDIKKCKKKTLVEEIKMHLTALGISGEYTYPSTAYTVEELVDLGLSKKYNTIVAIGGDEIIGKVAGRLCGRSEAFGIMPLEASSGLCEMIGIKNWREGAESLRFRKIKNVRIGKIANGGSFLTKISLDLKSPTDVTIEFKDYIVQARVTDLTISNFTSGFEKIDPEFLDVTFHNVQEKDDSLIGKISNAFGLAKITTDHSLFRARSLRLFTNSQIPLLSNDYTVAKTPQLIESSDEELRLIVGKRIN